MLFFVRAFLFGSLCAALFAYVFGSWLVYLLVVLCLLVPVCCYVLLFGVRCCLCCVCCLFVVCCLLFAVVCDCSLFVCL